ncbi:Inositol 2-dehydrogenase/D-chiro-inositol 3-dehydrogenase [Candidatus Lokiarchaeum ossiferum]|uniref:Inositol 2-dehydrogenase/D-chiro-inositol 3-dehydrogenase n=1 Tax=Candidatus Lokiarchaeum ossiferum TaxID=2951803 RepID=A0ABY6HZ01_9ARCH|nr:Inositol 2-dehydrogenase/D-chiro-inositol 3-dehydrogenase [Candidatus Lokiarchaeum sp. B-35]
MMETKQKKETRRINIGIIGCGHISQNHIFSLTLVEANARKIWKWKESEIKIRPHLYAYADILEDAVKNMAKSFPIDKQFVGKNAGFELIEDPDVHAVFILTPTYLHKEFVLAALNQGKHVFCEKPLCFPPSEIDAIIKARDSNHVVFQPGLVMRSTSPIHYLQLLTEQNKVKWGKPMNIVFRDSQQKPYLGELEVHNSTWRKDQTQAYSGILFEHVIHDIDGMISIFGEVEEVYAKINYFAGHPGIEDSVASIITFKNGINLSISAMWNDLDYDCRYYEIYFEKARITIISDGRSKKLAEIKLLYLDEAEIELDLEKMDEYFFSKIGLPHVKAEVSGPYYAEDLRFINAIVKNNIKSEITAESAKYAHEIIEACYESGRKGVPIKIQPFLN